MNDDISSLSALTQDMITQGVAMMSADKHTGMIHRIDPQKYYITSDPYKYPHISVTTSDRTDPSAIRQTSIQDQDRIIDKIYFDISETRAYLSRVENKSDSRIGLVRTDIDVLRSLITALQITVSQQAEAMKILAAEIDELKSGQLEPLEDY